MKNRFIWPVTIFCLCLGLPFASAQVQIARGSSKPGTKVKAAWYFDANHHIAWANDGLEWQDLGIVNVREMYAAGNIVVIRSELGYSLLSNIAEYLWAAPHIRVTDSLVLAWDSMTTHIYTILGGQYHPEHGFKAACWPVDGRPDTVLGKEGFCLPDFNQANDSVLCNDLRLYGIFGLNGHWLIPPRYDAPFTFQQGVADVILAGQHRKINELGEFVE